MGERVGSRWDCRLLIATGRGAKGSPSLFGGVSRDLLLVGCGNRAEGRQGIRIGELSEEGDAGGSHSKAPL